ncbi:alkaline phosphatase family protein [Streptomyces sp. H27-D2]|uniref:alkaline phosphatase family protein n=1 Tax=Streptomyces sp. H27-D2 TaxID=3046304 RepID=UPI002DB6CF8E|nr:alkaline phosphatase family protein [Streptomyces sp. H27-D2]MEC4019935.1 alkaline phosphatase family protein [Streptomyces sp. H27-D2]
MPRRAEHNSTRRPRKPHRGRTWRTPAAALLSALSLITALTATASFGADSPAGAARATAALPAYDHVVVVVFENKQYGEIIGSTNAPYINQLAAGGASLTAMKALTHPSQPNYFNLFSGGTQGITGDGCYTPQSMTAPNLGQELIAAGKTFATYNEDLPSEGSTACTNGQYAQKHNPWFAFKNVPLNTGKTWAQFPSADFTRLPSLSFVVPNQCNDMHSCAVNTGDTWLKNNLDAYAQWAKTHNSLLVVTWDEDNFLGSNQIATVFSGANVKQGKVTGAYNTYSLLRTFEDLYGTAHAGNAATATPITDAFSTGGGEPPDGVLSVANPGPQSCKFNQTCAVQITAAGGTPPRKYSAAGLPFGLAIDATTGRITGKTWQTGTFQITATATDSAQASASTTFPLTVNWF